MQDVERSLSQRNREQFTKNVNQFRREITSHIKTPSAQQPPLSAPNSLHQLTSGGMVHDHTLLSY